jgi:hypothetical protein
MRFHLRTLLIGLANPQVQAGLEFFSSIGFGISAALVGGPLRFILAAGALAAGLVVAFRAWQLVD